MSNLWEVKQQLQEHLCAVVLCSICVYTILTLTLTGSLLVFYFDSNANFIAEGADTIQYLSKSITTPPIYEITRGACNPPFERLQIGYFYGTSAGCLCDGVLKSGACSKNDTCWSKQNILAQPAQLLYRWDQYGDFCVKRNSAFTYGDTQCYNKSGLHLCPDQYTCVGVQEICPINIFFAPDKNPGVTGSVGTIDVGSYSAKKLSYGHQGGANLVPILNISASSSGIPCMDPNTIPKRKNSPDYKLYVKTSGCNSYEDDSLDSVLLDTQTEGDFYNKNNMAGVVSLPNWYYQAQSENVGLYSRTTIRITNPKCGLYNYGTLHDKSQSLEDMNNILSVMNILAFLSLVLIPFTLCYSCCRDSFDIATCFGDIACSICCTVCLAIFSLIFTFVYGFYALSYSNQFYTIVTDLGVFRSQGTCFGGSKWDTVLQDFIDPTSFDTYQKCFLYPQYLLLFSSLLLAVFCFFGCCVQPERMDGEFVRESLERTRLSLRRGQNPGYNNYDAPPQYPNYEMQPIAPYQRFDEKTDKTPATGLPQAKNVPMVCPPPAYQTDETRAREVDQPPVHDPMGMNAQNRPSNSVMSSDLTYRNFKPSFS